MRASVTDRLNVTSYNLSVEPSTQNKTETCASFVFPTDIAVHRSDLIRVWSYGTGAENCTWPDLNSVGNCSSPQLELLVVTSDDANVTVCDSRSSFLFPQLTGHLARPLHEALV